MIVDDDCKTLMVQATGLLGIFVSDEEKHVFIRLTPDFACSGLWRWRPETSFKYFWFGTNELSGYPHAHWDVKHNAAKSF
jgi:hypothetical protein